MPNLNVAYKRLMGVARLLRTCLPAFLFPSTYVVVSLFKIGLPFASSDLYFWSQSVAFLRMTGIFGSLYNLINCSRQAGV